MGAWFIAAAAGATFAAYGPRWNEAPPDSAANHTAAAAEPPRRAPLPAAVSAQPVDASSATAATPRPARFAAIPDLTQTDPRLGPREDAGSLCGPVAISNALMALAQRGEPGLLPPAPADDAQLALVRRLAGTRYMRTNPKGGTSVRDVLLGLDRYLTDAGQRGHELRYEGWRAHPYRFSAHRSIPELASIRRALSAGGAAFLHVGWYRVSGHEYQRKGGHWLTVVGVDEDALGRPQPGAVVVHDPAPFAAENAEHTLTFEPVARGVLREFTALESARGRGRVRGIAEKSPELTPLWDGLVTLLLRPQAGDERHARR